MARFIQSPEVAEQVHTVLVSHHECIDTVLQLVPESSGDLLDGSGDFRPFAECDGVARSEESLFGFFPAPSSMWRNARVPRIQRAAPVCQPGLHLCGLRVSALSFICYLL